MSCIRVSFSPAQAMVTSLIQLLPVLDTLLHLQMSVPTTNEVINTMLDTLASKPISVSRQTTRAHATRDDL
jgi:hypothetical protein